MGKEAGDRREALAPGGGEVMAVGKGRHLDPQGLSPKALALKTSQEGNISWLRGGAWAPMRQARPSGTGPAGHTRGPDFYTGILRAS